MTRPVFLKTTAKAYSVFLRSALNPLAILESTASFVRRGVSTQAQSRSPPASSSALECLLRRGTRRTNLPSRTQGPSLRAFNERFDQTSILKSFWAEAVSERFNSHLELPCAPSHLATSTFDQLAISTFREPIPLIAHAGDPKPRRWKARERVSLGRRKRSTTRTLATRRI